MQSAAGPAHKRKYYLVAYKDPNKMSPALSDVVTYAARVGYMRELIESHTRTVSSFEVVRSSGNQNAIRKLDILRSLGGATECIIMLGRGQAKPEESAGICVINGISAKRPYIVFFHVLDELAGTKYPAALLAGAERVCRERGCSVIEHDVELGTPAMRLFLSKAYAVPPQIRVLLHDGSADKLPLVLDPVVTRDGTQLSVVLENETRDPARCTAATLALNAERLDVATFCQQFKDLVHYSESSPPVPVVWVAKNL